MLLSDYNVGDVVAVKSWERLESEFGVAEDSRGKYICGSGSEKFYENAHRKYCDRVGTVEDISNGWVRLEFEDTDSQSFYDYELTIPEVDFSETEFLDFINTSV